MLMFLGEYFKEIIFRTEKINDAIQKDKQNVVNSVVKPNKQCMKTVHDLAPLNSVYFVASDASSRVHLVRYSDLKFMLTRDTLGDGKSVYQSRVAAESK